ncbi:hypothetical protein LVS58_24470, partial [Pseudomonas sp. JR33AA]|nr:hypothetical protein [Pseudomonas sp. JR33AA]
VSTFVSGQSRLWWRRAAALIVPFDIEPCAKTVARDGHRIHWLETNVGASLLAMRRAGGARSQERHKAPG